MVRTSSPFGSAEWPKPGRIVVAVIATNLVFYIFELVLLRAHVLWVLDLFLKPSDVFERGMVWQPVSYWWLHDPEHPMHVLFNLFFLYLFGARMERWWGSRRFAVGYVLFGLGGAALTLFVGLLSRTALLGPLLQAFWSSPHVGASGAVLGVTVAWGITFAREEFNFLLLGRMKGMTFVLIMVAIELLFALSLSPVSSTSHLGGIAAAFVVCGGWWRPGRWRDLFRRRSLERKKRAIEREIEALGRPGSTEEPGKDPRGKGGTTWN